jgi:hypothetical protein
MDFGDGRPPVLVQYYFVDEKTPFLPFPVNFSNRFTWATYKPWTNHPGEVWTPSNPRVSGARVRAYPLGHWIGTPQEWLTGLPSGTAYVPLIGPGTPAGTAPNVAGVLPAVAAAALRVRARSRSWAIVRVSPLARLGALAATSSGGHVAGRPLVLIHAAASTVAAGHGAGQATGVLHVAAVSHAPGAAAGSVSGSLGVIAATAGGHTTRDGGLIHVQCQASTRSAAATAGHSTAGLAATAGTTGSGSAAVASTGTVHAAATGTGKGVAAVSSKGTVKATATTAAFQTVTPSGGCGSLPASLHCRFTGGSLQWSAAMAGLNVTLTYSSITQQWSGLYTDNNAHSGNLTVLCHLGTWQIQVATTGGCTTVAIALAGTSGASPNLTATISGGSCTGSVGATVTRT